MPDSIRRAKLFRDRAEECHRLAEIMTASPAGRHYKEIAEHYLALAEAEERLAGKPTPPALE